MPEANDLAPKNRLRGFTFDEASTILKAALTSDDKTASSAAHRWIPWIAAYTGARISEIARLRRQDLVREDGISMLRIEPEVGQWSSQVRLLVLHPHLIELGFVAFIAGCPRETLFYDPPAIAGRHASWEKVAVDLGKWVRKLGISDPSLQLARGWRKHFANRARSVSMDNYTRSYTMGLVPSWDAPVSLVAPTRQRLLEEISRLPRYEL